MPISTTWRHLAAFIYDLFPIIGLWLITSVVIVLIRGGDEVPPGTLWFQLLLTAELVFYFVFSWLKGGQTLGMRAWKIGIEDFQTMTLWQSLARFLVGLVSTALLGAGLWYKKINAAGLSWMDMISGHRTVNVSHLSKTNP
ncbi:RDD family protein [Marinicella gelatinilytica]|uniref:RDD family protein n=1 Tax=Marinicella gelatinilytica TaxID=2996017 RepID=UPI002260F4E5|nr:RDD family protein [Marinicella gelatinilytica]MCX7544099.1 RDD family protein [Marinicella gelatinilytica]